jgi:hypothetical protein
LRVPPDLPPQAAGVENDNERQSQCDAKGELFDSLPKAISAAMLLTIALWLLGRVRHSRSGSVRRPPRPDAVDDEFGTAGDKPGQKGRCSA